jgi:hypothetical protein
MVPVQMLPTLGKISRRIGSKNDSLVIVQWLVSRQTVFLCNLENEEILFLHFTTA